MLMSARCSMEATPKYMSNELSTKLSFSGYFCSKASSYTAYIYIGILSRPTNRSAIASDVIQMFGIVLRRICRHTASMTKRLPSTTMTRIIANRTSTRITNADSVIFVFNCVLVAQTDESTITHTFPI